MEKQKLRQAKTILNNKRTSGGSTFLDFKLYCRAIIIKKHSIGTEIDTSINRIEDADKPTQL